MAYYVETMQHLGNAISASVAGDEHVNSEYL